MIKYSILGEQQLLIIAQEGGMHNKELNKEWRKRYGMNFPYKLNFQGEVFNCLMGTSISDNEVDKLILDQAIQLRAKLRGIS